MAEKTTARKIISFVCNEHRNSDLRSDHPAIIRALDEQFDAQALVIQQQWEEIARLTEKYEMWHKEAVRSAGQLSEYQRMHETLMEAQNAEIARLRAALKTLVLRYVANRGTKHEFICCVTPRPASAMTDAERKQDETWAMWDEARAAIDRARGQQSHEFVPHTVFPLTCSECGNCEASHCK